MMIDSIIAIISIAEIIGLNIVLNAIRKPPKTNEYPRILENFLYVSSFFGAGCIMAFEEVKFIFGI